MFKYEFLVVSMLARPRAQTCYFDLPLLVQEYIPGAYIADFGANFAEYMCCRQQTIQQVPYLSLSEMVGRGYTVIDLFVEQVGVVVVADVQHSRRPADGLPHEEVVLGQQQEVLVEVVDFTQPCLPLVELLLVIDRDAGPHDLVFIGESDLPNARVF